MRKLISYVLGQRKDDSSGLGVIRQYFDEEFYLLAYPETGKLPLEPAEHYFIIGWKDGYDPCPWFSSQAYLDMHKDVADAKINPFYHFIAFGRAESRGIRASAKATQFAHARGLSSPNVAAGPDFRSFPSDGATQNGSASGGVLPAQRALIESKFDATFYRATNSDLCTFTDTQLLDHFIDHGWREHRDPCPWFSTAHYLSRYEDIARGGVNPFLHYLSHGHKEGRLPNYFHRHKRSVTKTPSVCAIVPNFQHARFLEQRIQSIVSQDLPPDEIIILDDASTDDSQEVIKRLRDTIKIPVRVALNETNSGNVFRQWEKGVSMADAELIWICESDDFCEPNFLSTLAPYFCDPSIMIAFGAIQFATLEGAPLPGLDAYRESAAHGWWNRSRVEGAPVWFKGPFGLRNVIANVGGCLIRRQPIEREIWDIAQTYRVCGDWFLYMHLARGGRIAFDPNAVAYFRQHAKNTSVSSFQKLSFYEEHCRIALELQRVFGIDDETVCKYYRLVQHQYAISFKDRNVDDLDAVFSVGRVLNQKRARYNLLIIILGFLTGGGEIFPINLANTLAERGYAVSVMPLMTNEENPDIRRRLDSRIAIFEPALVDEIGFSRFIESQQIDLVHTHYVGADIEFHQQICAHDLPYVVTHHGSYEVTEVDDGMLMSIMAAVRHWVYISDKNLAKLNVLGLDAARTTKLPNAVPLRFNKFVYTRKSLGIEEDAFVFGVASRAIISKGWDIAARAIERVRSDAGRPVYLIFCGEGPDYKTLHDDHSEKSGVIFLGFQREIQAFYEMCDCAVLPTRFRGESFPLTLIEAMIKHVPVIATDIGEIGHMVAGNGATAGILIESSDDDDVFVDRLANAMRAMLDPNTHDRFVGEVAKVAEAYDFDHLVSEYEKIYHAAGLGRS